MKIGIIVDGVAEAAALKFLVAKLRSGHQFIGPVYADLQPKASPQQIAKKIEGKLKVISAENPAHIIVLIDREDRKECPHTLATQLEASISKLSKIPVRVVIKNRKFENWLVADIEGFKNNAARYRKYKQLVRHVVPDRADNVPDAEKLLRRISTTGDYHKRLDPLKICESMDVLRAAQNSRSFRRFLRLADHPSYRKQSKKSA